MTILPKTRSQLQEELEQKDARITSLETENAELRQDLEAAQSGAKDDAEKAELQEKLAKLESESASKDAEISELKGKLEAAEKAVTVEAISERVKAAIADPEKEENAPIAKLVNDEVSNRVAAAGHEPLKINEETGKSEDNTSQLTGLAKAQAAIAKELGK